MTRENYAKYLGSQSNFVMPKQTSFNNHKTIDAKTARPNKQTRMKNRNEFVSNCRSVIPVWRKCKSLAIPIFRILAVLAVCGGSAYAQQTLTWDPANTNNGVVIDSGSGAWDTDTTTNFSWNNGIGNVSWTQTSTTVPLNAAVFNGPDASSGTYQVVLDGSQIAVSNLFINANGYVFSGAQLANAGNGAPNGWIVADGKSVVFSNNIADVNGNSSFQLGNNAGPNKGAPASMTTYGNFVGGNLLHLTSTNNSTFYVAGPNNTPATFDCEANVWLTNGVWTQTATFQIGRGGQADTQPNNNAGTFLADGPNTTVNLTTSPQISRGGGSGTMVVQNGATLNVHLQGSSGNSIWIEAENANNSHGSFFLHGGTVIIGSPSDPTGGGTILLNKSGSSPGSTAVYSQDGGTMYAWGGILIGNNTGTYTGGTVAVTNSGGYLYIGNLSSIGVSYGSAGHAPTNYFVLSGGTIGALQSWISAIPMTLATLNGNITFQCADDGGNGNNIGLTGALTGPGGLNKTGSGTLTLSGAENYAGSTVVSNGTLKIVPAAAPVVGSVTLDNSAGGSPILSIAASSAGQSLTMNGDLSFDGTAVTLDFNYGSLAPSATVAQIQASGNVNCTGVTPQITVEGSSIPTGTYPLIKYGGSAIGTLPTMAALPSYITGYYLSNSVASKTIYLHVTSPISASLIWTAGSGLWDINTSLNWSQFGSPVKYTEPNAVQFDDTAAGPFPIVVTNNTTLNPTSITKLGTNTYTVSGFGTIASGSVTVAGGGTLTLAGTNTYNGGTTIVAGQLNINFGGDNTGTNSAIGTGPLTLDLGSKLDNTSGHNVALVPNISQNWLDDWTFVGSSNFNTGPGSILLGSSVITLTVVSNTLQVGGSIGDNGNNYKIQKEGSGTLALMADSSFAGGFELGMGQLNVNSANCLGNGIFTIDGGTTVDNVSGAPLVLSGITTIAFPISGATFTFLGSQNLDLGSSQISDTTQGNMNWNIVSNTLAFEGDLAIGNATITKIGQGTLLITGYGIASSAQMTINQGEVDLNRLGGVAFGNGGGGRGFIVQSNAIVRILPGGDGNQIYNGGSVVPIASSGGVFDLNGQTETLDGLAVTNGVIQSSASASIATLTIASNSPAAGALIIGTVADFDVPAVDGELDIAGAGAVNGGGSLVKTGQGVLNLNLATAYTGNTTISNGTLVLNFPGIATNSTVTINTNSALGTNGVLVLNFANADTNTVGALILGGVAKPAGIYNAATDPYYLSGSGSLMVVPTVVINPLPGPLQISLSGNTMALSWPTNLGWILQSQTNSLAAGLNAKSNAWIDLPATASVTSTNLPIVPGNPSTFFRLRHP